MGKLAEELGRLKNAPREDSERYKSLDAEQLKYEWARRGIQSWGPSPLLHQQASVLACVEHDSYMCLLDKGLGKTKVMLDVLAYRYHELLRERVPDRIVRGLVVCPNEANIQNWADQIHLHQPWHSPWLCPKDPADKREFLQQLLSPHRHSERLVVVDYSSLQTMLCVRVPSKDKGQKYVPDWSKIGALGRTFSIIALDEIHMAKGVQTLRYQMLRGLMGSIPYRYGATATLFNQDPQEAWPQFYLLDRGLTFGSTLTAFRTLLCRRKPDRYAYCGYTWEFDLRKQEQFHTWLRGASLHYYIQDCVDLPALRFVHPHLQLTEEQQQIYQSVKAEVIAARKKPLDASGRSQVVNVFQRLRRVLSGFIPVAMGEYVAMARSPKLEWLMERAARWNEALVVFYDFTATGKQITDALSARGWAVGWLYSGSKDKSAILRDWKGGKIQYLVVQNTVGAAGLDLQRARRQVFYECPLSAIVRSQAEARIWRLGQTRTAYIYDLFFEHTPEQKILARVREGMSLHRAIVGD